MRTFQILDRSESAAGVLTFRGADASLALRREGEYIAMSASYGALELALRPRARDWVRALQHIQPNDGLNTTWQVGTGDVFVGLGLHTDGSLIIRPTIVGNASGYFCLNLTLAPDAAQTLRDWLDQP